MINVRMTGQEIPSEIRQSKKQRISKLTHLEKQKDEVDCKGNKQSQQTHVVKIPCKVVLGGESKWGKEI